MIFKRKVMSNFELDSRGQVSALDYESHAHNLPGTKGPLYYDFVTEQAKEWHNTIGPHVSHLRRSLQWVNDTLRNKQVAIMHPWRYM